MTTFLIPKISIKRCGLKQIQKLTPQTRSDSLVILGTFLLYQLSKLIHMYLRDLFNAYLPIRLEAPLGHRL
jgi:hypothetical protein